jgi:putative cardiolipin synthase
VPEVSSQFDRYWNSASAYPAAPFVGDAGADGAASWRRSSRRRAPTVVDRLPRGARKSSLVVDLQSRRLALEWAARTVVEDDPAKTLDALPAPTCCSFPS